MVLKKLTDIIMRPLSIIFHLSWECGEVPVNWKLENVVPVSQKGKKENPCNYRQTHFSAWQNNRLIWDHDGEVLFNKLNFFFDKVTQPVEQGKPVDVISLDFREAFSTVFHSILLDKMSSIQLDKTIMRWVSNWLRGRAQIYIITYIFPNTS